MNPFTMLTAWWRKRQEQKRRDEAMLAVLVALTSTFPGNPPPSKRVQAWVNRTLKRRVF